jgi:hypothetical protein
VTSREPGSDDDDPRPAFSVASRVDAAKTRGAHVLTLADIEPRAVEWLWPDRLPAGMIAVLDGEPGAGKSTLVTDFIARLTTGRPFPNETIASRPPSDVVFLGDEDSPEHTMRPRLYAAGADSSRVHLVTDIGGHRARLPDDGEAIERVVVERGARLLVVDPVSSYVGQADFHRDNEVRSALAPLAGIAQRTGATVLLLRHFRKSGGINAMGRGLGSVAVIALARTGLILAADPDDPTSRILAWSKLSVGPLPVSLRCQLQSEDGDGAPRVTWNGTSDLTADELLAMLDRKHRLGGDGGEETAVELAGEWLMHQLEVHGQEPTKGIYGRAKAEGIAVRTLRRAIVQRGVTSTRVSTPGQRGDGYWMLVAPASKAAKGIPLDILNGQNSEATWKPAEDAHLEGLINLANDQDGHRSMDALADASAVAEPSAAEVAS